MPIPRTATSMPPCCCIKVSIRSHSLSGSFVLPSKQQMFSSFTCNGLKTSLFNMKQQLPSSFFPSPIHSSNPKKTHCDVFIKDPFCCLASSLYKPFGESPDATQNNGF